MHKNLVVLAIAAQLAGCGAIFNSSTAQVSVTTNAPGGQIMVDGQPTGIPAPGIVTVGNHKDHVIGVQMPDGAMGTCQLTSSVGVGYVLLDVVFTALLGVIVDAATGAWKDVDTSCHVQVMR